MSILICRLQLHRAFSLRRRPGDCFENPQALSVMVTSTGDRERSGFAKRWMEAREERAPLAKRRLSAESPSP